MGIAEIKKMSPLERLQTMEELWDVLCHEGQEIKSPEWHKEILDERKRKIDSGEAKFISLNDLKAGLHK